MTIQEPGSNSKANWAEIMKTLHDNHSLKTSWVPGSYFFGKKFIVESNGSLQVKNPGFFERISWVFKGKRPPEYQSGADEAAINTVLKNVRLLTEPYIQQIKNIMPTLFPQAVTQGITFENETENRVEAIQPHTPLPPNEEIVKEWIGNCFKSQYPDDNCPGFRIHDRYTETHKAYTNDIFSLLQEHKITIPPEGLTPLQKSVIAKCAKKYELQSWLRSTGSCDPRQVEQLFSFYMSPERTDDIANDYRAIMNIKKAQIFDLRGTGQEGRELYQRWDESTVTFRQNSSALFYDDTTLINDMIKELTLDSCEARNSVRDQNFDKTIHYSLMQLIADNEASFKNDEYNQAFQQLLLECKKIQDGVVTPTEDEKNFVGEFAKSFIKTSRILTKRILTKIEEFEKAHPKDPVVT